MSSILRSGGGGIHNLEQNIFVCFLFAAFGGIMEVCATAILAYPASKMISHHQEYTDFQLRNFWHQTFYCKLLQVLAATYLQHGLVQYQLLDRYSLLQHYWRI